MNIWYLCVLQLGSNWPLDTWPCWVFLWLQSWCPSLSERGSFSCPRSSGLLFSVDSTSFGIFLWFFEHQKWIVAVASWSYHIISMCFWLADLLLAEMRWFQMVDPWKSRIRNPPFVAAKLGPDLRYRTIIAIEHGDLSWIYPLKMVIFHSYVSLPEGNSSIISISFEGWRRWQ
jgi:hypothetical protein